MNRIRSLFVLCFLVPPLLHGQAPPAAAPSNGVPKIEFGSTTFNFGKLKSGETVKHEFTFTNSGNATLQITEVKPGCGCTTAGAWDKTVEPGKTGVIPLQFNSTGFSGQVGKSATVTCNDPAHATVTLVLEGTVWKPIDISPQMAMFTLSSETPTNETKVLRIVNHMEEPITLSNLQCSTAAFKTELKEVKPGREFDLLITAVPPFTTPTLFASITIKTSSTNVPTLTASAYATVQQAVTITPQQVMLPGGELKTPVVRVVQARINTTNSLAISDPQVDLSGVELKLAELQTGKLYSITMTFPAGLVIPAGKRPELTFKSVHARQEVIRVPIIQMPAPAAVPPPVGQPHPAVPPPPAQNIRLRTS